MANDVLGGWLVLSPWALAYESNATATANAVIVGVLLAVAALGAIFVPRAWEELSAGVLALWMIASPWFLNFSGHGIATLSAVVAGGVILALATWTVATDREYAEWTRRRLIQ